MPVHQSVLLSKLSYLVIYKKTRSHETTLSYFATLLLCYSATLLLGQTLTCSSIPGFQIEFISDNDGDPCVYTLKADNQSSNLILSRSNIQVSSGEGCTATSCPTVSPNSSATWTITGMAGDPCGSVSIQWATGAQATCGTDVIQLPVELVTLNATTNDQTILLQWQTASEENNSGFEVQRSKDAQNWEVLDFVKGYGTTIETQNYKWLDDAPLTGTSYYQLKQIDTDGTFEYSDVVVVDHKLGTSKEELMLFPNPVTEVLNYQVADIDAVRNVQLFDVYGKLLKVATEIDGTLSLENVTAGMYVLVVETNGTRMQQMVVKN